MTPHARQRGISLVIAFALVMIDASTLFGQQYPGRADFQTPNSVNNYGQTGQLSESVQANSNNTFAGKANINQSAGNNSRMTIRKFLFGTEPKRVLPSVTSPSAYKLTPLNQAAPPPLPPNTTAPLTSSPVANNPPFKGAPNSAITQASHMDTTRGLTREGGDPTQKGPGLLRNQNAGPYLVTPMERGSPPPFQGSIIGSRSQVTNVEEIAALKSAKQDMERENDELRRLNAGLQSRVKEKQDQLISVIREVNSARKDMTASRHDLDRLKSELQNLREKMRVAQKEHTDVLQSMGPLLQQLLESDDVGSLPTNPTE